MSISFTGKKLSRVPESHSGIKSQLTCLRPFDRVSSKPPECNQMML